MVALNLPQIYENENIWGKLNKKPYNSIFSFLYFCYRILVFSTAQINSVEVYIDDEWIGAAHHIKGPVYMLQWNPDHYRYGLHSITVIVQV